MEVGGSVVASKSETAIALKAMEDGGEPFSMKFIDMFAQIIAVENIEPKVPFGIDYDEQRVLISASKLSHRAH